MNYIQFALFFLYIAAVFSAGTAVYAFINRKNSFVMNSFVLLAETLLLGSIVVYGEMFLLSFVYLYKAAFLWTAVCLNFVVYFSPEVRKQAGFLLKKSMRLDFPLLVFISLLLFFVFRNLYFLMDVDSHSVYLYTPKVWLSNATSLVGDKAIDMRIFLPQFDSVPYGLGLSVFPNETLFPMLINIFWRIIVLFLVFGYITHRFNRYYGLAGAMMVLFNDHMFFSGANQYVIINAALVSFIFAALYNFWESRQQKDAFRFLMGLIFLPQFMSNKYQAAVMFIIILFCGVAIQPNPLSRVKQVFSQKRWVVVFLISALIAFMVYLKNWIVTGLPVFPVYAGKFQALGWVAERGEIFMKIQSGLKLSTILKYLNYLFIWPGIKAAKIVAITLTFFPILLLSVTLRKKIDQDQLREFCFWLGISVLCLIGTCLTSHQDPRYYRYLIAVFTFTAIFSVDHVLQSCFFIKKRAIIAAFLILFSLSGYKIMFSQGGDFIRPTFRDNIKVLTNRLHTKDVIEKHYPITAKAFKTIEKNPEKLAKGAWDMALAGDSRLSAFFLPIRPQVSLWHSTLVRWESFEEENLIIKDLKDYDIEYVMQAQRKDFAIISTKEYAKQAVQFDRRPKEFLYVYGFPDELKYITY